MAPKNTLRAEEKSRRRVETETKGSQPNCCISSTQCLSSRRQILFLVGSVQSGILKQDLLLCVLYTLNILQQYEAHDLNMSLLHAHHDIEIVKSWVKHKTRRAKKKAGQAG